ncbi:glycosyltransferase family 4 protein [Thermocoleostomius sinensis]|uniref:Glycosyltransferase family 4 protein n=1 Tax=Thermocoleostomius sinensis A174 TaxID=2016057 RepID=A0A9E9CAQ8_9CYAN|nr:glycosyltransferase family 4 protein [Thermocoleostomius sinensis]WAL61307.1 glycosyltransferase family 4 protein [Thermocoleostomius sinensis A174]
MKYHVVLSKPVDLASFNQRAEADHCPRHIMWNLSQQLNATVHKPEHHPITAIDRICARIAGQPEHWALGRALVSQLDENDFVYCQGEDVGLPLAILCKLRGKRPKLAMAVMAPDRPRVRGALQLFGLANQIDLFLTNTKVKSDSLCRYLGLTSDRVFIFSEQTDVKFFTPGEPSPQKTRPIVASAGLEQRDYHTLAEATHNLDLDVRICAVSPNATAKQSRFPNPMPSNMTAQHYDWTDLRQLYRDANVVAISLLQNQYSAGLTVLMEAMACRRPVVMTRTTGLAEQLIDRGVVLGVEPGDAVGMRQAIMQLLNHPEQAEALAQQGYDLIQQEHTSELHIERIITAFKLVAEWEPVIAPQWSFPFHLRRASSELT